MKYKLSPPYDLGDCGYHVVITGLFYLALKAKKDPELAKAINSSKSIGKLLKVASDAVVQKEEDQVQCLLRYLDAMSRDGFDKLCCRDVFEDFAARLKDICVQSDWLKKRIKEEIKSGLWSETHPCWEKFSSFQQIKRKITEKEDELYAKLSPAQQNDGEIINKILFEARIQACEALADKELIEPVNEVLSKCYGPSSKKAWLDSDFLKSLVKDLLGSDDYMFAPSGLMITGSGPSRDHWYIELPDDLHSQELIKACNSGYQRGLEIISSPEADAKRSYGADRYSLFPQAEMKTGEKDSVDDASFCLGILG